jgi:hypothetical protein
MNKVSALSLLSNAVLVWNSVWIAEIVGHLERSVARPVRPEILARVSPLWHGHVIANGATTSADAAPAPKPNFYRVLRCFGVRMGMHAIAGQFAPR